MEQATVMDAGVDCVAGQRYPAGKDGTGSEFFGNPLSGLAGFAVFLLVSLYIPVILIRLNVVPFHYRFHASILSICAMTVYCIMRRHGFRDLGFRLDTLAGSLIWNGVFCMIGTALLVIMTLAGFRNPHSVSAGSQFYPIYILLLAPAQELFFRSFLFAEIKKTILSGNRMACLLITSVSFCVLHMIYAHITMLPVTFVAALLWGLIYERYPNFLGVALSHSFLGMAAIVLGII